MAAHRALTRDGGQEEPFVEALRVQGASTARIVWLHIVPNVMAPFLVQATFVFAEAVLSEAALSFLGLGIKAPDASWETFCRRART
ncbi:MAG: ABC transporter permease subunit [Collinsella sp.]